MYFLVFYVCFSVWKWEAVLLPLQQSRAAAAAAESAAATPARATAAAVAGRHRPLLSQQVYYV